MDLSAVKKVITTLIEARKGEITAIVEDLYRFRETGLQEHKSAALLADILEREGFTVERGIAGLQTAFSATHGERGPAIAILAEMDALPEIGHACGHNIIAAAAVGAGNRSAPCAAGAMQPG